MLRGDGCEGCLCTWLSGVRSPAQVPGARERCTEQLVRRLSVRGFRFKKLRVLGCLPPVAGEPAELPGDDRVRLADQNPLHCNAELRPVAAATGMILIRQHIDKLVAVVRCGPLDTRALDLQRVVLRAGSQD
jgi:hypothetical protein